MKKLLIFILSVFILNNSIYFKSEASNIAEPTSKNIAVYIDAQRIIFDVHPQLIGGRTMVPLRAIFENLGATVQWDETTQTVTAFNEFKIVKATVNSNIIDVNGQAKTMDIAPMIVDNRTLIPIRFVAEAFECDVEWDSRNMAIYITTAPVDYSKAEQDNNDEIHSQIYYYDCKVPFPTYDSVTGAKFIDIYSRIWIYELNLDEILEYIEYLQNEGWKVLSQETNYEDFLLKYILQKDSKEIHVVEALDYKQVWIIF